MPFKSSMSALQDSKSPPPQVLRSFVRSVFVRVCPRGDSQRGGYVFSLEVHRYATEKNLGFGLWNIVRSKYGFS